ncbi:perlwapin-like [Penaeus indicus]|uniref:perlwapin-like n=1 Tax=Penaeus indicus TaxID=29960 RepID=UPI00300C2531
MLRLRFVVLLAACFVVVMASQNCTRYCQTPGQTDVCCDPPPPPRCPYPPPCIDFFDGKIPFCNSDHQCPPGQKCCTDACSQRKVCLPV